MKHPTGPEDSHGTFLNDMMQEASWECSMPEGSARGDEFPEYLAVDDKSMPRIRPIMLQAETAG
eukprot:3347167-Lingulodinium_polyedra.AAC.1